MTECWHDTDECTHGHRTVDLAAVQSAIEFYNPDTTTLSMRLVHRFQAGAVIYGTRGRTASLTMGKTDFETLGSPDHIAVSITPATDHR